MKVEINRRTVKWILVGLAIVIAIVLMVMAYRRRSNLVWPVTTGAVQADTDLQTNLNGYQDTYNLALIDAMKKPTAEQPAAILAAETTLNTSIKGAVASYVTTKCPAAAGTQPTVAADGQPAVDIWNDYQADLGKVQKPYYLLLKDAKVDTSPTAAQIQYARQADITGATRKYMAKRCPSFYYVSVTDDPTPTYQGWTAITTGSKPTTGYGIHTPSVTTSGVNTWLDYAATVYTSSALASAVSPAAGTSMTITVTLDSATGISVGDTIQFTYQTMNAGGALTTPAPVNATVPTGGITGNTVTLSIPDAVKPTPGEGMIIPSKSLFAKAYKTNATAWKNVDANGVPNWKKARDAGPGTYPAPTWA